MGEKKIVEVGCGIIRRGGKVLIAQRPHGSHLSGYWEFPGGKKHEGETIEDCLRREIFEELGIRVEPSEELCVRYHDYPDRRLRLRFYFCDWISGNPVKKECMDFRLVAPEELYGFLFPPADRDIIVDLIQKKRFYFRTGPFV